MDFSDSKFATAADQLATFNAIERFLRTGCRWGNFTQRVYRCLHIDFPMIAHYDRTGFFDARFGTLEARQQTWTVVYRAPEYTDKSDLVKAVKRLFALYDSALRDRTVPLRFETRPVFLPE